MYNYFMLIGVVELMESKELESGRKLLKLTLKVRRTFKNMEGEYIYDNIPIEIEDFLAEMIMDSVRKGDKIAIKGRVEMINNSVKLCGDKAIFFDTRKESEEE